MININNIKVSNMSSGKGRDVPNQFIIKIKNEGEYFQSYNSIIAFVPNREQKDRTTYLDETYWNYSMTTRKYRCKFLGEDTETTKAKIKNGEYALTNLN